MLMDPHDDERALSADLAALVSMSGRLLTLTRARCWDAEGDPTKAGAAIEEIRSWSDAAHNLSGFGHLIRVRLGGEGAERLPGEARGLARALRAGADRSAEGHPLVAQTLRDAADLVTRLAERAVEGPTHERGRALTPDQKQIDEAALSRFTLQMREKLAAYRAKGRDGWHDPALCPETRLAEMLIGHLPKGNPGNLIDLAILAMMLQERGADPAILLGPLARGDLAQPWRPISEALKGGPAIWARLHADLSVRTGRPELKIWDGVQVPLRHPGTYTDEGGRVRDHGWNVAAPVGHGGFPDDWIAGWVPLRGPEAELAWAQSDRTGPAPD
jgi:hypothetical protein